MDSSHSGCVPGRAFVILAIITLLSLLIMVWSIAAYQSEAQRFWGVLYKPRAVSGLTDSPMPWTHLQGGPLIDREVVGACRNTLLPMVPVRLVHGRVEVLCGFGHSVHIEAPSITGNVKAIVLGTIRETMKSETSCPCVISSESYHRTAIYR